MPIENLEPSDREDLVNLLLNTQKSRSREALCRSIGIDPSRLSFLTTNSERDFYIQLVEYIIDTGKEEAICKLCCQEIFPHLYRGNRESVLTTIAQKLGCKNIDYNPGVFRDQGNNPNSESSPRPRKNFWTTPSGLMVSAVLGTSLLVIIGFFGYNTINTTNQIPPGTYKWSCDNIRVKGNTLIAQCKPVDGDLKDTVLENFKDCKKGIENNDGKLECKQ